MGHLITPDEARKIGRPMGKVDNEKLAAYIAETEQMYVIPAIGTALFLELSQDGVADRKLITLLNGGTYTDCRKEPRMFAGLRQAVAYYVYAQNVMSGDFQSTRFGMRIKEDDYSERISAKERSDHYNNTLGIAARYLQDCVDYCKAVGLIKPGNSRVNSSGITIRKIG